MHFHMRRDGKRKTERQTNDDSAGKNADESIVSLQAKGRTEAVVEAIEILVAGIL
jgi:hypothetical protein